MRLGRYRQRQRSKGSLICTPLSNSRPIRSRTSIRGDDQDAGRAWLQSTATKRGYICRGMPPPGTHAKAFIKTVDAINAQRVNPASPAPRIELAPLPSGAQFLNVIESVFSGMARAVVHNSDYGVGQQMQAGNRSVSAAAWGSGPGVLPRCAGTVAMSVPCRRDHAKYLFQINHRGPHRLLARCGGRSAESQQGRPANAAPLLLKGRAG